MVRCSCYKTTQLNKLSGVPHTAEIIPIEPDLSNISVGNIGYLYKFDFYKPFFCVLENLSWQENGFFAVHLKTSCRSCKHILRGSILL